MGKLFDSLKQAQAKRNPLAPPPPTIPLPQSPLQAVWPEEGDSELVGGDEVPFIEVGEPRVAGKTPTTHSGNGKTPRADDVVHHLPAIAPSERVVAQDGALLSVRFQPILLSPTQARKAPNLAAAIIAFHEPAHAISAQYRAVANALLMNVHADDLRLLLFSGASTGCGTTTVVLNTAVTLARLNARRVILVDAHVRRNAIAARLDLEEAPGLREVLSGFVPLEAVIRSTAIPRLDVLTAGTLEACPPSRLTSEAMRQSLRSLRERYDLVLVDGPSWDGRPEVVALGAACDAVYLCLPEAAHATPEAMELMQAVPEQGGALRGCILTSH